MQAYVLVQTEPGYAGRMAEEASRLPGVMTAEVVAGPYDVIARIEAGDVDEIGRLVVSGVQGCDGVTRTLTCHVALL